MLNVSFASAKTVSASMIAFGAQVSNDRRRLQSAKTGHSVRALNFMEKFIR
jgi:hypothetical protein